jgi:hypothetical protein
MNVLGYLEEVLVLFNKLLCKQSLLSFFELLSMLTFGVNYVYFDCL